MYKDLVPLRTNTKKRVLDDFAAQVEEKLAKAKGPDAMAAIVCRLLTSKDQRVAALMVCKWVEWRYGKPQESGESVRNFAINIINHVPRPGESMPISAEIASESEKKTSPREWRFEKPAEVASEPSLESSEKGETRIIQSEPKSKQ